MTCQAAHNTRDDTAFADLLKRVRACRLCADAFNTLGHAPRPVVQATASSVICIVGQAPGTKVHASGLPFDDPSGDRLRGWMGIGREVFYDPAVVATVPMGFCFPGQDEKGGDLPPRKECAPAWRTQIFDHLPNVKVTLLVGGYAQKWHLGKAVQASLTETVRHWRDYLPDFVPMPHPSWRNTGWLKKNPWFEKDVVPYVQARVKQAMEST